MASRNYAQLRATFQAYKEVSLINYHFLETLEIHCSCLLLQLAGHDMIKAIEKEMSGDVESGFKAIG